MSSTGGKRSRCRASVPSSADRDEVVLGIVGRLLLLDGVAVVDPRAVGVPEDLRVELQAGAELDRRDGLEVAARGVENVELEVLVVFGLAAAELEARAPQQRDPVALRRPGGVGVVARRLRQPDRRNARRREGLPDVAALGVAPRDVGDPAPVGREGRRVLAVGQRGVVLRQALRRADRPAARELLQPDAPESLEGDPAPVGRLARPAEDLRLDRAGLDLLLPGDARRRELLDLGRERNVRDGLRGEIEARDLPLVGKDEGLAVRREGVARPDVHRREALHLVARDAADEDLFGSRGEVPRDDAGVVVAARDEGQRLAVGRDGRPDRAAEAGGDREGLREIAVVAPDLPEPVGEVRRVAELADPGREVDRLAVPRNDGAAGVVDVVGGRQLDSAAAALAVEDPELHRRNAGLLAVFLAGDHVLAVGRPGGAPDVEILLGRQGLRILSVGVHQPDVVDAAAVARERDRLAVRGEARLRVVGGARGQGLRGPAADRHRVDVAEEIEDDRLPVGRDVERRPGSLARRECDLPGVGARRVDVGGGVFLLRVLRRIGGEGGESGDGEQKGEDRPQRRQRLAHPYLLQLSARSGPGPGKRGLSPAPRRACQSPNHWEIAAVSVTI